MMIKFATGKKFGRKNVIGLACFNSVSKLATVFVVATLVVNYLLTGFYVVDGVAKRM